MNTAKEGFKLEETADFPELVEIGPTVIDYCH